MKTKIFLVAVLTVATVALGAPQKAGGKKEPKPAVSKQTVLWKNGDNGVKVYRIPALCTAPDGKTLVAACDARHDHLQDLNRQPWQKINIAIRTSKDGGKTWAPSAYSHEWTWNDEEKWAGSDPSFVVDAKNKKIFLFYNVAEYVKAAGVYRQYVQESADNGKTWSEPRDISDAIRPAGWSERGFVFITSGSGIQTKDGALLHTLVWVGKQVALFGSDDGGATWKAWGAPTKEPGDECKVVELSDGRLMINSRKGVGAREIFTSADNGATWEHYSDTSLMDGRCNAQIITYPLGKKLGGKKVGQVAYPKEILAFSNCNAQGRSNLTLRTSWDDGQTWTAGIVVEPGRASYSDLCLIPSKQGGNPPDVGVLFEGSGETDIRFCTIKSQDIIKK